MRNGAEADAEAHTAVDPPTDSKADPKARTASDPPADAAPGSLPVESLATVPDVSFSRHRATGTNGSLLVVLAST